MDILKLAEENQKKARRVIADSKVIEAWQSIGAEINQVGSMAMGLLMKHRDIDFHIYTDKLNIADSFAAIAKLAENPRIKKVTYDNLLEAEDCCLEWHAWYEDEEENLWQIDMMHIVKGSEFEGYFEHIAERIKTVITPEQKETVLRLKYETPEDMKIAGIEYYKAVLRDDVQTFEEFMTWREENPLQGIEKWVP